MKVLVLVLAIVAAHALQPEACLTALELLQTTLSRG